MWPVTPNVVVEQKLHICLWTLRYFQVCMDSVVTEDWQARKAGKVLELVSTLEPGRQASAQTLKATKHRSQTNRKAPRGTCLHMLFFTHTSTA